MRICGESAGLWVGDTTNIADLLTGWYRGLRRVRKEEPRHLCLLRQR